VNAQKALCARCKARTQTRLKGQRAHIHALADMAATLLCKERRYEHILFRLASSRPDLVRLGIEELTQLKTEMGWDDGTAGSACNRRKDA
jgi:hypothetical protein